MFGFTAKITKTRICIALLCIILIFVGVFVCALEDKNSPSLDGSTTQKRVAFLQNYNWQVDAGSEQAKTITIPYEFDNVYTAYNNIQKAQGFDLCDYKGKQVSLYTLKINNYPNDSRYVFASILVCENKIIGGDVHSTELSGFMHGFALD